MVVHIVLKDVDVIPRLYTRYTHDLCIEIVVRLLQ